MQREPENEQDEEIILEDTDAPKDAEIEETEATAAQKLKDLRQKLQESETARRELLEELQRVKADFLNSKKRLEEEQLRSRERDTERFIESLLPLCDSFTMAMSNKEAWEAVDQNWRRGVEGINQQLLQILTDYQVTVLDPQGQHFDPEEHEALGTEIHDGPADMVLRVIQYGYKRGNTIIRPAKVIISTTS